MSSDQRERERERERDREMFLSGTSVMNERVMDILAVAGIETMSRPLIEDGNKPRGRRSKDFHPSLGGKARSTSVVAIASRATRMLRFHRCSTAIESGAPGLSIRD